MDPLDLMHTIPGPGADGRNTRAVWYVIAFGLFFVGGVILGYDFRIFGAQGPAEKNLGWMIGVFVGVLLVAVGLALGVTTAIRKASSPDEP